MKLFQQIEHEKSCNRTTQNIEVTEVTEVTSPKSLEKRGYKIEGQEVTEVTDRESLEKSGNDSTFSYLLDSIQTAGPYAKLWPQVRNYCRRELDPEEFKQLEAAHKMAKEKAA